MRGARFVLAALAVGLAAAPAWGVAPKKKATPDAGIPEAPPPPMVDAPLPAPAAPPPAVVAPVPAAVAPEPAPAGSPVQLWAQLGPKIVFQGGTVLPGFSVGPELTFLDVAPLRLAAWVPVNLWYLSVSASSLGGSGSATLTGLELVPQMRAKLSLHPLFTLAFDFGLGPLLAIATTSGTFVGSQTKTQGAGVVHFGVSAQLNLTDHFKVSIQPFGLDVYFGDAFKSQGLQMYSLLVGAGYRF